MLRQERIILIVSILTGVVAFGLILNYLNAASQPKHSYVLASVFIPKGRVITSDNLTISGPMAVQPNKDDLFFQIQDVVGYTAQEDIPQWEKIRRSAVRREEPKPEVKVEKEVVDPLKMVYPIPKGMGGLMIQADQVNEIPAQLAPGRYVNIMGYIPDYMGQMQQVTLVFSCMVTMFDRPRSDWLRAFQVALTPQESEMIIAALNRGKLRLVLLQEPEEKPLFSPAYGQIEVIRGTNEQRANTYGTSSPTVERNQPTWTQSTSGTETQGPLGVGMQGQLGAIEKTTENTMKKTAEKTATP